MADAEHHEPAGPETAGQKQCRICFDGEDPQLGRLLRPCLCKGSISHVHVKCLQQWRNSAHNPGAFYACPQCGYKYHFARTKVVGIATNPVVVAVVSSLLFTILAICSSFVTTWLLSNEEDPSGYTYTFYYPLEIFQNLVRATIRFLIDDQLLGEAVVRQIHFGTAADSSKSPGLLKRLLRRFLLGLPVVGAGSIAHMLLSVPLPLHWFRMRSRVGRDSRDLVAFALVLIVLAGAARALYKVYKLTKRLTEHLLLRAEDAILEVA